MKPESNKMVLKIFLIIVVPLLVLLGLPVIISHIIEYISSLHDYFPSYSRAQFFTEYYKHIFTFLVMVVGFWYADSLIEKRILKKHKRKSTWLKKNLTQLKPILNDCKQALESGSTINIEKHHIKLTAHFNLLNQIIAADEIEVILEESQSTAVHNLINLKAKMDEEKDVEEQKKCIDQMLDDIDHLK